jgi:phosphopentomutase
LLLERVEPEDLVMITADHGNDPTYTGTDHTREEVPILVMHDGKTAPLGVRETFADVSATLAQFFGMRDWNTGRTMLI